jgi:hypothetical protein
MLYKLLDEYENKLMTEEDPKKKMVFEKEIDDLNEKIQKAEDEIKKLN